jgi:hypothetical protein
MAYQFIGTAANDRSGSRVTSGDFDGDGITVYAIGEGAGGPGAVFLVAGTDLQALDRGNAAARLHAAVRIGRP